MIIKCPSCDNGKVKEHWHFPIITSIDCKDCRGLGTIQGWSEYILIKNFYGEDKAERSQVPLIKHIDEGLFILNKINASFRAALAYCVHPIFQSDANLDMNYDKITKLSPEVVALVMEYRSVANEYLSTRKIKDHREIRISPLREVTQMLIADKIQNRKDFELYHLGSHPRSAELVEYFNNWMIPLDISEEFYEETKKELIKVTYV